MINPSSDIFLELKDANVTISEWNEQYIQFSYENFSNKGELDIKVIGNTFSFNSDLDFSGFKHLDIKVPKSVININARKINAKSGVFRKIRAEKAELRNCILADGFLSEGENLSIRGSKFSNNCVMKNETVILRKCEIKNITLSTDNRVKKINAFLRELKGNLIRLETNDCKYLMLELRDSLLDKFIVNYLGDDGNITIFKSKIEMIENNSKLNIIYKNNFIK